MFRSHLRKETKKQQLRKRELKLKNKQATKPRRVPFSESKPNIKRHRINATWIDLAFINLDLDKTD
jgi:hypothetical protein